MAGRKKKIYQYSREGIFLKEWKSLSDAANSINGHKECISICARGRSRVAYNNIWLYARDDVKALEIASALPIHTHEDLDSEEWRDVVGYEGLYQVSNYGRVKTIIQSSVKEGFSILKQSNMRYKNGTTGDYQVVSLIKRGKQTTFRVHRLVAIAFIPNPDNLPCVNHKDENKTNNCADNLEWCTHEYNNLYGTHRHANKNHPKLSRPINQYKDGVLVNTFPSIAEAARHIGKRNISAVLQGKKKHCGGYEWRYV